jgi:replication factor C large subunit
MLSVIGQDQAVNSVLTFLARWPPKTAKRALLLWGPSGIGKTLLARELASEKQWDLIEVNASDKRSAKKLNELLSGTINQSSLLNKGKLILIDEVDGLSGNGDRGGIGEIVKVVKKSSFPVILICANPYDKKFLPLRNVSTPIEMKPLSDSIIEKILTMHCNKNNIPIDPEKIRKETASSKGDARRAIISLDSGTTDQKDNKENIFKAIQIIFRSKNATEIRNAIKNCDKSPNEIFRWIIENINTEFTTPSSRAKAYEILSQADIMQRKHKSWINHLLKFSQIPRPTSFKYYKPPAWFFPRKETFDFNAHCSQRKLTRERAYMQFLD